MTVFMPVVQRIKEVLIDSGFDFMHVNETNLKIKHIELRDTSTSLSIITLSLIFYVCKK